MNKDGEMLSTGEKLELQLIDNTQHGCSYSDNIKGLFKLKLNMCTNTGTEGHEEHITTFDKQRQDAYSV